MCGENTVNVREQDERISMHHLCNETRKFIVIGKHQLGNADRIVLVDDGQYVVLEHDRHTGTLVAVLLAGLEVLLHGEHLADMDAELTEQVVVQSHEFHLSDGRKQLALFHRVERVIDGEFPSSAGHST